MGVGPGSRSDNERQSPRANKSNRRGQKTTETHRPHARVFLLARLQICKVQNPFFSLLRSAFFFSTHTFSARGPMSPPYCAFGSADCFYTGQSPDVLNPESTSRMGVGCCRGVVAGFPRGVG